MSQILQEKTTDENGLKQKPCIEVSLVIDVPKVPGQGFQLSANDIKSQVFYREILPPTDTMNTNKTNITASMEENISDTQSRTKETISDTQSKVKETISDTQSKIEQTISDTQSKIKESLSMSSLIQNAQNSLESFISPTLNFDQLIPIQMLSNCYGLIFLTAYKGGVGVEGSMGTGILLVRKANNEGWTGPCAIGMGGISAGLQIGFEKVDHILILHDENILKQFINKGQLILGGDLSVAVGPLGRAANKGNEAIYSYSLSKGAHIGSSLERQVILTRDDCNAAYYGSNVHAQDILYGNVGMEVLSNDTEYLALIKLIEEYSKTQVTLSSNLLSYTSERENEYEQNSQQSKIQQNTEQIKQNIVEGYENLKQKVTEKYSNKKEKIERRLSFPYLLRHGIYTLENFVHPKLNIEKQIPVKLLSHCYGLMFLTEFKGGFGVGGSIGTGFIIARMPYDNTWSYPCAVALGGLSLGFQIGAEKVDHIFMFRYKYVLDSFATRGQLKLGVDASFACGPFGRDLDISSSINTHGYAAIYSYSTAKGLYGGVAMEGQVIMSRADCNQDYFGQEVTMNDILSGNAKPLSNKQNDEYSRLIALLNQYVSNPGQLSETFFLNEQDRQEEESYWQLPDVPLKEENNVTNVETNETLSTSNVETTENLNVSNIATAENLNTSNVETTENLNASNVENTENFGISNVATTENLSTSNVGNTESFSSSNMANRNFESSNVENTETLETSNIENRENLDISNVQADEELKTSNFETREENLSMSRLLNHARESLENFMNPHLNTEKQIPTTLLNDARGIIFLTELKAGLLVGTSFGTGVMITRPSNSAEWSGPCAVGSIGMSIGLQIGAQKTEHLIIVRKEGSLKIFALEGKFKLGTDVTFAPGPLGRDANLEATGYTALYSYSMSRGMYKGTTLEGQIISTSDNCNAEFYGKNVTADDILFGHAKPLEDHDYKLLCESLNRYFPSNGDYSESVETNVNNLTTSNENINIQ